MQIKSSINRKKYLLSVPLFRIFEARLGKTSSSDLQVDHLVISLQMQPLLSLADKLGMEPADLTSKLCSYLRSRGADAVFDLRPAEDICLLEMQREFVERWREKVTMLDNFLLV